MIDANGIPEADAPLLRQEIAAMLRMNDQEPVIMYNSEMMKFPTLSLVTLD